MLAVPFARLTSKITLQLVERAVACLDGTVPAVRLSEIDALIDNMAKKLGPCSAHGCGTVIAAAVRSLRTKIDAE